MLLETVSNMFSNSVILFIFFASLAVASITCCWCWFLAISLSAYWCLFLAYARACYRLNQEGQFGCKTVFDVAPKYLAAVRYEELLKTIL